VSVVACVADQLPYPLNKRAKVIRLIILVILHFLADFVFQTRDMAINKTRSYKALSKHCVVVFLFMFFGSMNFYFALTNAVLHGFIDKNIWRYYRRQNKKEGINPCEDQKFYITLGMDQAIHMIVMLISFEGFCI
jgi:hypothetical protein